MRILALDLGTNTGWALGEDGNLLDCGTKVLATKSEITAAGKNRMNRRQDPRVLVLWEFLREKSAGGLDWIVFEDVEFSSTRMQAHLWATWRTVAWIFAFTRDIQVECLGVQKLKQFGTGHGGATKEMMMGALPRVNPNFSFDKSTSELLFKGKIIDDNSADAAHLFYWASKTFRNT